MPSADRAPQPTPLVVGGYVAYAAVGWFLSGLGSVLPELDEQVGAWSAVYPLLPGATLLGWGLAVARRQRIVSRDVAHRRSVGVATIALVGSVLMMGLTGWVAASLTGALAAAVAAAWLIRLLPAALAVARPSDTERVMMRANAWSSLAGIASPLAIGATIGIGIGWLPGMAGPLVLAGASVVAMGRAPDAATQVQRERRPHTSVPPIRAWWRAWTVLTLSIVIEFCFAYYAATYLHDEVGLTNARAAAGAAAFGVGMAIGRFVVSAWPRPDTILPTVGLISVGFALLWGVATPVAAIAGILIAGAGIAPLYPTRVTALLGRFPGAPDQGSTRGSVASGAALLGAPALMASLRGLGDVRTAYLAVPMVLVALVVLDVAEGRARSRPASVHPTGSLPGR